MMKIGFSSLACPAWDLETIVKQASTWGFDGVELRGLTGELNLPLASTLAGDPAAVKSLFSEHKIELVCLASSATLTARSGRDLGRAQAAVAECAELAGKLGCPRVRIYAGEVERGDDRAAALVRTAKALGELVPLAQQHGVTLLVENGGDFPGSADLWYLLDAVNNSAVRCCWNQCHAMTIGERATNSIPRLGRKIGMVHICDAKFDAAGVLLNYVPPGEGDVEVTREIELLRGVAFRDYLVFEWPKMWLPSLSEPGVILPAVATFLKARRAEKQPILSAYKGDKNAPKLASLAPS